MRTATKLPFQNYIAQDAIQRSLESCALFVLSPSGCNQSTPWIGTGIVSASNAPTAKLLLETISLTKLVYRTVYLAKRICSMTSAPLARSQSSARLSLHWTRSGIKNASNVSSARPRSSILSRTTARPIVLLAIQQLALDATNPSVLSGSGRLRSNGTLLASTVPTASEISTQDSLRRTDCRTARPVTSNCSRIFVIVVRNHFGMNVSSLRREALKRSGMWIASDVLGAQCRSEMLRASKRSTERSIARTATAQTFAQSARSQ